MTTVADTAPETETPGAQAPKTPTPAEPAVLHSGRPCRRVALLVGILGLGLLGAIALACFLKQGELTTFRLVTGAITSALAGAIIPYQLLDVSARRHTLTETSLIYRYGVFGSCEIEIPLSRIHGVMVRQNLLQKLFGCGDVRVSAQGMGPASGLVVSQVDNNSILIRSTPDHVELSELLRQRMRAGAE